MAIARVLAVYHGELARIAPALVEGEDSDALHAYRVALRASRAVLNARRGVFPRHDLNWIRNGLRWLARETGPARDLDVVLEATSRLASPGVPHADAGPLREALCARRIAAEQRLRAALQGPRYSQFTLRYAGFLANRQQRVVCRTRHGNEAIAVLMDGAVQRRYRQVHRAMQRLHAETPIDDLHDLRKRAKSLRYLLHAFANLYPDGA
ncbi:MAG: CHAD domain-containing protein, partial [Methylocella sp.]